MAKRAERRREQRTSSSGGSRSGRMVWILGGAGLLGVAIVLWNVTSSAFDDTARQPVEVSYETPQELLDLAQGISSGDPDAPVTIMEFADYQCPSCQAFVQQTKPFLDMTYVENGHARFVFYDFPLVGIHAHAFLAARAARCAGDQDAYWGYHDRLFQTQPQWASRTDPASLFETFAGELGLNQREFRSCLRSDRHAEVVTANQILGEQLGVQGTPTVMVDLGGGEVARVQDWSAQGIRQVVDPVLDLPGASEVQGDEEES